ncbi:hypothetical protein FQA47_001554 [Oryzias melastigma]|uniref:Uncharacterized protein n=1 Tax=Oryzias melastigma TaxID=30732 RepID=A0A834FRW7_ORYME|nr:hypothetical protein FQA47_001554 [Oryzias melastigma]
MQRGLSEEVEWTPLSCVRSPQEFRPGGVTRLDLLQTLRDGEVEEESAAPPSIYAAIATPLVHDFIAAAAGGRSGRARTVSSALFRRTSCRFGRRVFVAARLLCRSDRSDGGQARRGVGRAASS